MATVTATNKVARLMRLAGLRGCPKRRLTAVTSQAGSACHPVAENLFSTRTSTAEAPNQRWHRIITVFSVDHQARDGFTWRW